MFSGSMKGFKAGGSISFDEANANGIGFKLGGRVKKTYTAFVLQSYLLHPVFKFIKFKYILENKAINKISLSDLLKEYVAYCSSNDLRPLGKIDFYKKLKK